MRDRGLTTSALRTGGVAGVIVVYLGLVGMIESLEVRNLVGTAVTAGGLLLAVPALLTGWIVNRARIRGGERVVPPPSDAFATGALAGAASGAVVGVFILFFSALGQESVRAIFIRLSPGLLDQLQLGQGTGVSVLLWIGLGAALGAIGAAFRVIPRRVFRPLIIGLVSVLGLALLQRIVPPAMLEIGLSSSWLYSPVTQGLTFSGAIIIFVVAAALTFASPRWRSLARARMERVPATGRTGIRVAGVVLLGGFLAILPNLIGTVLTNALASVGIFLLLGLGLNIVVGYAGLLDLGYVAFFAVGAYFMALLSGARTVSALGEQTDAVLWSLNPWVALPIVVFAAAMVGLLIGGPVLRLRGDYLAIVTLGFGEIARVLFLSNALRDVAGGAQGLQGVPTFTGFSRDPRDIYYLALIFVFLAIFVSRQLADSRIGRAWNAMREDEQVAEAMGVSTTKFKLLAFAIGGAVGSLGGALFAVQIGSLTGTTFSILVSVTALAVIILGGMGSIPGVIVGSIVLIGIPALLTEFEEFRLLIYGAVLVAIMILRPQGLIPNVRRSRELQDEERTQDRWLDRARAAAPAGEGTGEPTGGEVEA